MTVELTIAGHLFESESYRISESISSLTAGDSSGAIATFDVTIRRPDPYANLRPGNEALLKYGPDFFVGEEVTLSDSRRGTISGTVRDMSRTDQTGSISYTCISSMEALNTYNVKSKPFRGTLENAIKYYLSLAGITSGFSIDSFIAPRPVNYIGWAGELWHRLKMLAMAQDFEMALVDDVIVFRRTRQKTLIQARDVSRSASRTLNSLAKSVEVYNYNTSSMSMGLVYPTDGWDGSLEVLNVNAGEVAEYQLELNSSIDLLETPTMVENVGPDYKASSVYTIVANDGLPIPPAQWREHGGKVMFSINDDTTSLTATLWGAVGIYTIEGELATNFSLALASDATSNRYSTLRLRGRGVRFKKEVVSIRTGVSDSKTNTDVGVTVDNPFLTDLGRVYRVGMAAAAQYAGTVPSVTGDVVVHSADNSSAVGNVVGMKVYDSETRRWYRATSVRTGPDKINFSAEDDFTFEDLKAKWDGLTFGQVTSQMQGLTFRQADATGWEVA